MKLWKTPLWLLLLQTTLEFGGTRAQQLLVPSKRNIRSALTDRSREWPTSDNNDVNATTNTTAAIMSDILRNEHTQTEYLNHVRNPMEVASELQSAANYLLMHETKKIEGKTSINDTDSHNGEDEKNADLIRVLDGFVFFSNLYDVCVRPGQFDEEGPTNITVTTYIHPWFEVDEQRNEMTVTLTLVQNWTDPRLAYESRLKYPEQLPYVTLTSQMHIVEVWLPDTFVLNEKRSYKHEITAPNDLVRISSKGHVSREQRMTITAHCPFYLNDDFPFDTPTCSLKFTSFSSNVKNIKYAFSREGFEDMGMSWLQRNFNSKSTNNPFYAWEISGHEQIFERSDQKLGSSSGFVIEFGLKRSISPYITKLYLPLASFSLISIAGLMSQFGPEIGCGISYFMFGLSSIFMAISFNGSDFNWGYGRTALDSYYVICVMTMLITGIVNIFKLRQLDSNRKRAMDESFEMHQNTDSSSNIRQDGDEDDGDNEPRTRHNGIVGTCRNSTLSCFKSIKIAILRMRRTFTCICVRFSDFSMWFVLAIFIVWNVYYWIKNLS